MNPQNFEQKNQDILRAFEEKKKAKPDLNKAPLQLSWSNWGFGMEPLEDSVSRLARHGIRWIELHGNHYGKDLGYQVKETVDVLRAHDVHVSGICGMFSPDNDPASNRPIHRQAAIDYIRRELEFGQAVGASYLLICPSAVGRPQPYDPYEFHRSVEVYRSVAADFETSGIRGAVEPIRSAEVSICHTVAEVKRFIEAIGSPAIQYINGDVFHMQAEEAHIPSAILEAGEMLINLHMADSNRGALGEGSLDLDAVLMALYLINYNREGCFVSPEPLGPGGDPYPAMNGRPEPAFLEHLVGQTARYFRERERVIT